MKSIVFVLLSMCLLIFYFLFFYYILFDTAIAVCLQVISKVFWFIFYKSLSQLFVLTVQGTLVL